MYVKVIGKISFNFKAVFIIFATNCFALSEKLCVFFAMYFVRFCLILSVIWTYCGIM
jgi:hypothetical protein